MPDPSTNNTDPYAAPISCKCGNGRSLEGWYSCDNSGHLSANSTLLCCCRCGTIVDRLTRKEVRHRPFAVPQPSDSARFPSLWPERQTVLRSHREM